MGFPVTAIYDANVLYSAPVRDLFVRLAQAGLVRARWTDAIHDEWVRSLIRNNAQITSARLERTRNLLNESVRDCLVTDYEGKIRRLSLPDPDDRHILAAAIHTKAQVIITFNVKDFPRRVLSKYGIEAVHPDDFLVQLFREVPARVCVVVKQQRAALKNPPYSVDTLLNTFQSHGLLKATYSLRAFAELL